MIQPRHTDIGRRVIYRSRGKMEEGWITSFNDNFVFVLYHAGDTSAATRRQDLDWAPFDDGEFDVTRPGSSTQDVE